MGAIDSGNTAWILTSASLVFLMTPGVAFFYGGMVRAKAVLNMLMLEAAALSVTMIIWTLWGWSIAYAGSDIGGIFGDPASGFLLKDSMVAQDGVFTATGLNGNNYPVSVDVAFQVAFAMITVGLICGAIAERVKYSTWMIFVALWVTFDYAPMAHMVWNGGLLSADGAISKAIGAAAHDFAGGTVVHINAAVAALIIVLIIGKRKGFGTQPFRPHNVPFVMLGAFLLWFGWFGFNAGSAFAANRWLRLGLHFRRHCSRNALLGLHREDSLRPLHRHGCRLGYGRRPGCHHPGRRCGFPAVGHRDGCHRWCSDLPGLRSQVQVRLR